MKREEELKEIIKNIIKTNPYISEETAEKAYQMYASDERDISEIALELRTISAQIMKKNTQEAAHSTKEEYYHQMRYQELSDLYQKSKSRYTTRDFQIIEIYETDNIQSYNATRKVKIMDKDGNITYGFLKGISSLNECELLVSRLGKVYDIPVAEFSLYLENGKVEGISVSCNPDEEKYEFILGYDFVSHDEELQRKVSKMRAVGPDKVPIGVEEIKRYIELFFDGVSKKVKYPEQLEQIKKDYLEMVLFNVMIDQKDFNYTNFALLHSKETDSYQMAPLFDNGNIKDPRRIDTIIIGVENARQSDVLDVLYSEYYEYIQGISETIAIEVEKYELGDESKISKTIEIINDTLSLRTAPTYTETVTSHVREIAKRENEKKQELAANPSLDKAFPENSSRELDYMLVDSQRNETQKSQVMNDQGHQKAIGTHPAMNPNFLNRTVSTLNGGENTEGYANTIPLLITTIILGLMGLILYIILK